MAQTGYTPIQLYYSTTASAAPTAGNLASGELAINITDGKLYYKDNGGNVQVLATKDASSGSFTNATVSGSLTLSGGTANGVAYLNGSKVLTTGSALTFDGANLAIGTGTATNLLTLLATSTPGIDFLNGAGTKRGVISASSSALNFNSLTSNPITWQIDSTEQMRLTSTGLGIKTTSITSAFNVAGDIEQKSTSNKIFTNNLALVSSSANFTLDASNASFLLKTGSGTTLTADTSGNLGLGVTPNAWNVGKVFQVGSGAGSAFYFGDSVQLICGANAFYSSGWKYGISGPSSNYEQAGGAHRWFTAPSGTAGNAISFTQAMTLDASGNLSLANTDGGYRLRVRGTSNDGAVSSVRIESANAAQGINISFSQILGDTGNTAFGTSGNFPTTFVTNNTERARIDSSGNLLVGTTSKPGGFANEDVTAFACGGGKEAGFAVFTNASTSNAALYIARRSSASVTYINFATQGSATGSITTNGTTTTYNTTSDYRLKTVVGNVTNSGERIDALNPVEFEWKSNGKTDRGFLAHQFQAVYPNSVTGAQDGVDGDGNPVYQAMQASSSEVIADLVAEIKALRARVAALEAQP